MSSTSVTVYAPGFSLFSITVDALPALAGTVTETVVSVVLASPSSL